jgi:hypothetical protein
MENRILAVVMVGAIACRATPEDAAPVAQGSEATSSDSGSSDESDSTTSVSLDIGSSGLRCDGLELAPSSVGCSFVAGMHREAGVALANMSDVPATVTISDAEGVIEDVVVAPGATEFAIWTGDAPSSGIYDTLVRFIESDQPIQAWQFTPPLSGMDNDASVLLPFHTLGTRHRIVSYVGGSPDPELFPIYSPFAELHLVMHAIEDDTDVTVRLVSPRARANVAQAHPDVPSLDVAAGDDTITVQLDRGQTLVLSEHEQGSHATPPEVEWTGGLVTSTAPIAVYVASMTMIPWGEWPEPFGMCCADTIADAVPPTSVLGTRYVGVKTMPLRDEYDIFRVVANQDGTRVTVSGDASQELMLDEGEFADIQTTGAILLEGNHAFSVAQFMVSSMIGFPDQGPAETHDCGVVDSPGDPALQILFPIDNWLDAYRFPSGAAGIGGGGWCHNHATITARIADWSGIRLDDEALPEPQRIGDSELGYVRVPLTAGSVYGLESATGNGVQLDVYGYRDDGSYIYPGGLRLEGINPEG